MKFDLMATAHLTTSKEVVPAVKIFDNMAIIGTVGTNCVVIETSEGLILLDALWPGDDYIKIIEDGLQSLGYDPADIKILLISHDMLAPVHGEIFTDMYAAECFGWRIGCIKGIVTKFCRQTFGFITLAGQTPGIKGLHHSAAINFLEIQGCVLAFTVRHR